MRPIQTAELLQKKEIRNRRIAGVVIIALLLLSTAGFALNGVGIQRDDSSSDGLNYNGQSWVYTTGSRQYSFTSHPDELVNVSVDITSTLADFSGKQMYIASETGLGTQEIFSTIGTYASRIGEACYESCTRDLPEKTCVAGGDHLIVVRLNEDMSVTEQDSCIFIDGDIRAVDAFLYQILGIN